MAPIAADYRKILQIAGTLAAALIVISASRLSAEADPAPASHMLIIPASDGYGFDDCLGKDQTCGKVIADAWCEAHGMSASASFGRADEITASIPAKAGAAVVATKIEPGSFVVNCKD